MEVFQIAILILFGLAISDLIVGVSNDAVNFLNSSIGSRVAPRNVIMIIASLGMLAGVTFSSGMMEVAREGIFHPQFFTMPELMTIFLAAMLTDIILLDLYNTFGLPTSTTVSIVFELLGAAVAVSLLKLHALGEPMGNVLQYINTAKALAIIGGMIWGKATWNVYWTWDARLTLTAIMLFVYVGYLALRRIIVDPEARARRSAILGIVGLMQLIPVHFSVTWWRTLHQTNTFRPRDNQMDGPILAALLISVAAFTIVYAALLRHRIRLEDLELEAYAAASSAAGRSAASPRSSIASTAPSPLR